MSKTKRLLAMLITVIMTVSMLTVVTFAEDNTTLFSKEYSDPTGTILNTAYLVDSTVASYKVGDAYSTGWDGKTYTFIVGKNAFPTITAAIEGSDADPMLERLQLLLTATSYGELRISRSMDIFGVNWNNSPNAVNPTDPTLPWALNASWSNYATTVTNVVVEAGASESVSVLGIKVTGRIYDNFRPVSLAKTTITFKNILMEQTPEGVANFYNNSPTGRSFNVYAISLWNSNAVNKNESAKRNKDETYFVNFRIKNLASPCTRIMDERVSPKITFDGFYFDDSIEGLTSQGWWMKWNDNFADCQLNIKNSCFADQQSTSAKYDFESFEKKAVGIFDGQYSEMNIVNNLFYDAATSASMVNIYAHGFSTIHIDGNTVINKTISSLHNFIGFASVAIDNGTDYTDRITMRDNTVVGITGYGFEYGNELSHVDMTGTYVKSTYTNNWLNETSTELPTGNVSYEYCYLDAKRTKKSSDVPSFTVNGISPDANNALALSAGVGKLEIAPNIVGLSKYEIYASDKDFSNNEDWSESKALTGFTLENNKNYFLLIAYSYDLNSTVPYKVTASKAQTSVNPGELSITTSGATQSKDGLVYHIDLDRNVDNVTYTINSPVAITESSDIVSDSGNATVNYGNGAEITGIEPNETVVLRHLIYTPGNETEKEYFYVYVTRSLSNKCDIVSATGATVVDSAITADVAGSANVYSFNISVSEGAAASAWAGTAVYPMDENGNIEISDIKSGANEYTVGVVAENGVDYKLYSLTLNKEKNSEAKVISIANAVEDNGTFTATARRKFEVNPTVSLGASFKVFKDAACSQLVENNVVSVAGDTTVYIVVTSESGTTVSAPVALNIKKSTDGITVAGATIDANDASLYVLKLADNLSTVTLSINAQNATYKLYSDKKLTNESSAELKLDQGTTYVYANVTYSDGETEVMTVKVISNRSAVAYKDAGIIPNWAKTYINKLDANGLGILKGDSEGNFNASNSMTRYEVAAIAVRLLGIDATQYAGVTLSYADTIAPWAVNYVKTVTKLGIMGGSANGEGNLVFDGAGSTTRAQLAKIVVEISFFDNQMTQGVEAYYTANKAAVDSYYNNFNFVDEDSVQNWAKTYVKLAVYAKYFNGSNVDGKNFINGKDNIKRSEIAAVATRFLGI